MCHGDDCNECAAAMMLEVLRSQYVSPLTRQLETSGLICRDSVCSPSQMIWLCMVATSQAWQSAPWLEQTGSGLRPQLQVGAQPGRWLDADILQHVACLHLSHSEKQAAQQQCRYSRAAASHHLLCATMPCLPSTASQLHHVA